MLRMCNTSRTPQRKNCEQAVTGCLVWALDRTTFRHTILEAGRQRRQKYEVFLANVSTKITTITAEVPQLYYSKDLLLCILFVPGPAFLQQTTWNQCRNVFAVTSTVRVAKGCRNCCG